MIEPIPNPNLSLSLNDGEGNEDLKSAEIRLRKELALIQEKRKALFLEKQEKDKLLLEAKMEKDREWIDKYEVSIIRFNSSNILSIKTDSRSKGNGYLQQIGCSYNVPNARFHYPVTEASKLASTMLQIEKNYPYSIVEWGNSARLEAEKQLSVIEKVANLATAEDIPDFENHTLLQLRPFQKVGAEFAKSTNDRCLEVFDVGLGKTLIALERAEAEGYRTIIVCPAKLRGNWIKQCKKITGKTPHCFLGSRPDREDLKRAIAGKEQYYILTYESLRKFSEGKVDLGNGLTEVIEKYFWADAILLGKFDFLIADEIHNINNVESHQSKSVRLLSEIPKIMTLSATPMKNRREELFPILNLLAPKEIQHESKFMEMSTHQLQQTLNRFMIRRSKTQVLKDLPAMERIDQTFELTEKGRRIYDKVEAGIIGMINDAGEFIPQQQIMAVIAKLNKLRQIVSYSAIEHTADLATELYDDAVDNNHDKKKVIIFSFYKLAVYGIAKRLGQEAIAFTGEDKKSKTGYMEYVEEFQNNPDKHFLVMQLMTGSEGFDITEAENIIFNDMWWAPYIHEQGEGRAYGRLNDLHGAKSFWMMAENTISEDMAEMLKTKLEEIAICIDGAARDRLRSVNIARELISELKKKRRR